MSVVKFGTSGWRGITSDAFTFGNVELAARASGTEPVFRYYLEAGTNRQMAGFRRAALELVK